MYILCYKKFCHRIKDIGNDYGEVSRCKSTIAIVILYNNWNKAHKDHIVLE